MFTWQVATLQYRPPIVPVVSVEGGYRWCGVAYLNSNNCLHVPVHLDYISFIVPNRSSWGVVNLSFMLFPYYTHLISLLHVYQYNCTCCLSSPYSNCKGNTSPVAADLKIGEDIHSLVSKKWLTQVQLHIQLAKILPVVYESMGCKKVIQWQIFQRLG